MTYGPGNELTCEHGFDLAIDMIREIMKYEVLYHIGEKLPYDRLERDAKADWQKVLAVLRIAYPSVPDDLYWNQWRKIRGEYFSESCPQIWKNQLPFLGASEIPNRYSTRSNICSFVLKRRHVDNCLDEYAAIHGAIVKRQKTTPEHGEQPTVDKEFRAKLKQNWSNYAKLEFPEYGYWVLKMRILKYLREVHNEADEQVKN